MTLRDGELPTHARGDGMGSSHRERKTQPYKLNQLFRRKIR